MKTLKQILIASALLIAISGCKKNDTATPTPQASAVALDFKTLAADNTTIAIGSTTTVKATATGEGLTYIWAVASGSAGDIIGSGASVTYGASPCCGGNNTITCTVKDASNAQQSKSITIIVQ